MRAARSRLVVLGWLGVLSWGCGHGITGNLPPVTGRVFAGDDPQQGLAQVEVVLVDAGGQVVAATLTDAEGTFRFDPAELPQPLDDLHIEVRPFERPRPDQPAQSEQLAGEAIPLLEPGDQLLISMRPERLNPPLSTLRLEPQRLVMRVGEEPIQFRLLGADSASLEVAPTWVLRGKVGILTPEGLFTPQRPGRGQVIAQIGRLQAEAVVTVLPPMTGTGGSS